MRRRITLGARRGSRARSRTSRAGGWWASLAAALGAGGALLALPVGCSSDDEGTGSTTPLNPSISIVLPAEGACVAVGDDPDAHIPVQVKVADLVLRPPGVCGGAAGCGHLVLRVNGVANNIGASAVIDVLHRKLAAPYADLEISVEVANDAGEPLMNTSVTPSTPVVATVKITTKATCGGGTGGAGGSGGTGGSGGAGGAGGSGGSGTGGAGGSGGSGGSGTGGAGGAGGSGGAGGAGGA